MSLTEQQSAPMPARRSAETEIRRRYIELLKRVLCRYGFPEDYRAVSLPPRGLRRHAFLAAQRLLRGLDLTIVRPTVFDPKVRSEGRDWPAQAETMIGLQRMDNIQYCVETVLADGVPGDLIETGVWRGGATIFMRGILGAYGIEDRVVWVADSFEGLPPPNEDAYPADRGDRHFEKVELAISLEEVQNNFRRYDLLDDQVRFLKGWFKDTLPSAPIDQLAVLRMDGDMYESTMDAISALYPKLAPGGFVIVDDYGAVEGCRKAIEDYRQAHDVHEPIMPIDGLGVYWRRESGR